MSNTIIDNYVFAKSSGPIELKRRSVTRFATTTSDDAGAQVNPESGVPFTLELTKYVDYSIRQLTVDYHLDRIGRLVYLESAGIRYYFGPYFLKFLVLDVQIVESKAIARACGYANGVAYDHSPAWMVVSRWTLQAVST